MQTGQCLRILVRPLHLSFFVYLMVFCDQTGHDNWIRALVFHPTGKTLLSASDDKTIRIWDLATGRCTKTVDAHGHFVTSMAWGRTLMGGSGEGKVVNGDSGTSAVRKVNVLATGSVDQTVKVS